MGPSAVRVAGLESKLEALGYNVKDGGNISVAVLETRPEGDPRAKYLTEITETCSKEAELVLKTLESGHIPIILGGDHSIAAGTVSGVAEFYRRQKQKIGLIWIDAHSDINTPEIVSQRERAWHAAGRDHGTVRLATQQHFRLQPQGEARQLRAGRHPRRGQPTNATTSSVPGCTSSPCATSTSAACEL